MMAHVVFPAAGRPTIIRIYENRTKRGAVNSVYHGSLASPLAGDREGDSKPHSHLWEMEAVNSVYLIVLLLGVKQDEGCETFSRGPAVTMNINISV